MTVKRVEVLAYAKINLMLDIIRRRTDGYHDLFMIMQSVGVADRVTVEREPGRKLRLTASMDDIPLDDKNIAWKAAALFFKTTGLRRPGLHIHLEKHIPHAAGLAGGSADGAAVLRSEAGSAEDAAALPPPPPSPLEQAQAEAAVYKAALAVLGVNTEEVAADES